MRIGRFDRFVLGAVLGAMMLAGTAGPAKAESPNSGKVAFSFGVDFTTAYFFRGILQERDGLIVQPYGEINYSLFSKDEGCLTGFTLIGGMWNSVHSERTLESGSGPGNWYEADVYAGFKWTFLKAIDFKTLYIAYTYPNGSFQTVQELDYTLALNDSEWLGMFALYPSVTVAQELDGTALGQDSGWYGELNLRPTFTIVESDSYPVSLAIPLQLGVSLADYYEGAAQDDDKFGFFKAGAVFSVPLAFMPSEYGAWSASAGASIYAFGDNLKEFNEDDTPWVVGTWSINWTY